MMRNFDNRKWLTLAHLWIKKYIMNMMREIDNSKW